MASMLAEAFVQLSARDDRLRTDLARAFGMVTKALGAMQSAIRGEMAQAMAGIGNALGQFPFRVQNAAEKTKTVWGRLGTFMKNRMKNVFDVAVGIHVADFTRKLAMAPVNLATAFLDANRMREDLTMALSQMLGSPEKGQAMFAQLQRFAKQTPFEMQGVAEAAVGLMTSGFKEEEVMPLLDVFGRLSALSPVGAQNALRRLILVMGQVRGAGRALAGDMNQIKELGIPIWEMLAEQMGVAENQVRKMGQTGAISARDVFEAMIKRAQSPQFADVLQKASLTFTGRWTALKDQIFMDLGRIGEPFFETVKRGMLGFLSWLEGDAGRRFVETLRGWMAAGMESVGDWMTQFQEFVEGGGLERLGAGFMDFLGRVEAIIRKVGEAIDWLGAKIDAFNNRYGELKEAVGSAVSAETGGLLSGFAVPVGVSAGPGRAPSARAGPPGGGFVGPPALNTGNVFRDRVGLRSEAANALLRMQGEGMMAFVADALGLAGALTGFGGGVGLGGGALTQPVGSIGGVPLSLPEGGGGGRAKAKATADVMGVTDLWRNIQTRVTDGAKESREKKNADNLTIVAKTNQQAVALLGRIAAGLGGGGPAAVFGP